MKEIVNIDNGNGVLEIKGGKYDSALFLNGELIQFTFLREIGSTWRYQIAKGIKNSDIIREKSFSNFVKYGFLTSEPLSNQFDYILNCLTDGKYQIELTEIDSDIGIVEIDENVDGYYSSDTYEGMIEIIETQYEFEEKIVEEYLELVEKGNKPITILLKSKDSENTFIVDGHHKFAAYGRLKKNAKCLIITKLDCETINKEEGISLIENTNIRNTEYKKRFLERIKK